MKKFLKGVLFVAAVAAVIYIGYHIILGGFSLLMLSDTSDPAPAPGGTAYIPPGTEGETDAETEKTSSPSYEARAADFYYAQLNESEKVVYAGLYDAVRSGKNSIRVKGLPEPGYKDMIKRSVYSLTYDHPELFWLNRSFTMTRTYSDGKTVVLIELHSYEFYEYSSNPQRYVAKLENKVAEVASLASGIETEYEKAKFFYKYLAEHTEYDDERLAESQKTVHSPLSQLIYTPYACLVEGRAVCAGYAKAFQMLCEACGIECTYITGWGGEERHGWSCVKLDGEYYFVDPTWGDGEVTYEGKPIECVNYEYLCMNKETLGLSHLPDEELLPVPVCDSDKYDYFVYNGFLMSSFSDPVVSDVINRQAGERPILLKFTDKKAYAEAADSVSKDKISALKSADYLFSRKEDRKTVYIYVIDK